jgi:hypothetical protein
MTLYFLKFVNYSFKFQKKSEKILDVDNDEIYKQAKS